MDAINIKKIICVREELARNSERWRIATDRSNGSGYTELLCYLSL